MVLSIPIKVISTIHQLADSCNKHEGIVFTDKDGNILNNIKDLETHNNDIN